MEVTHKSKITPGELEKLYNRLTVTLIKDKTKATEINAQFSRMTDKEKHFWGKLCEVADAMLTFCFTSRMVGFPSLTSKEDFSKHENVLSAYIYINTEMVEYDYAKANQLVQALEDLAKIVPCEQEIMRHRSTKEFILQPVILCMFDLNSSMEKNISTEKNCTIS